MHFGQRSTNLYIQIPITYKLDDKFWDSTFHVHGFDPRPPPLHRTAWIKPKIGPTIRYLYIILHNTALTKNVLNANKKSRNKDYYKQYCAGNCYEKMRNYYLFCAFCPFKRNGNKLVSKKMLLNAIRKVFAIY